MADTRIPSAEPGAALLRAGFFWPGATAPTCTASRCRQTDHPSVGPTAPSTNPAAARAAPPSPGTPPRRPACATRTSGGVLLELYREALARTCDPVLAWADIQSAPERRRSYQQAPGKDGLVRTSRDEAVENSGRRRLPLVPVENFHALRRRLTTDETKET